MPGLGHLFSPVIGHSSFVIGNSGLGLRSNDECPVTKDKSEAPRKGAPNDHFLNLMNSAEVHTLASSRWRARI